MFAVIFICGNLCLRIAGKIAKIRTRKKSCRTIFFHLSFLPMRCRAVTGPTLAAGVWGKAALVRLLLPNPPPRYHFSSIIWVATLLYYPGTVHMIQDFLNSDESRPHKPLLARSACGRHALEVNFSTWIFEPCVNDWNNNITQLVRVYSSGGREAKHGEAMSGSPRGTQIWWPNWLKGNAV